MKTIFYPTIDATTLSALAFFDLLLAWNVDFEYDRVTGGITINDFDGSKTRGILADIKRDELPYDDEEPEEYAY